MILSYLYRTENRLFRGGFFVPKSLGHPWPIFQLILHTVKNTNSIELNVAY